MNASWRASRDTLNALRNKVIESYSRAEILDLYSHGGLWASEQKLFHQYYRPGQTVLDIGCGIGRTTFPLANRELHVVGIDITRPMLNHAHYLAGHLDMAIPFLAMDAGQLAFRPASFDHVLFSYNGIELIPKLRGKSLVMGEIYRVLKPGGTFIFTVHNLFALDGQTRRWLSYRFHYGIRRLLKRPLPEFGEIMDYSHETGYLHCLTPPAWRKLLMEAGFQLISVRTTGSIDRNRREPILLHWGSDYLFYLAQKPDPGGTNR